MKARLKTRTLVAKTAMALLVGTILVIICYFSVDRPTAWFVHDHRCWPEDFWWWPPRVSEWLKNAAVWALAPLILWWAWKPGGHLQTTLLAIGVTGIVTGMLKQLLKWTAGRYWPETWKHSNPSLIGNGAYGFNPFHSGSTYESFPSGHAAVTCAIIAVCWISYPRCRWLCVLFGGLVCVALVGMNYHFVSDVIAGAIIGSITGVYMARLFRLGDPQLDCPGRETEEVPAARQ
jgi:membrane-associated phospholipid phosphatase